MLNCALEGKRADAKTPIVQITAHDDELSELFRRNEM